MPITSHERLGRNAATCVGEIESEGPSFGPFEPWAEPFGPGDQPVP